MKNYLLPFVILLSSPVFGQNHPFKFGVTLSPGLTGNFLSNDGSVSAEVENKYREQEKTTFGFSGQLFAQYTLNAHFKLQAGIGYTHTGYVSPKHALIFEVPKPGLPEYMKYEEVYEDLSLPLQLRYHFKPQNNGIYFIGGFTPIYKLKRLTISTLWYDSGAPRIETFDHSNSTDYRDFNVNGSLGMGYAFKLNAKLSGFLQPTFDCNWLFTAKSTGINRRIYALGLSAGLILG